MRDDVEFDVVVLDPEAVFDLRLHIATFLEDIVVQPTRALDQVATPVIGVLKTCVVAVAVVDDVGLADFFVTIATDPEGGGECDSKL